MFIDGKTSTAGHINTYKEKDSPRCNFVSSYSPATEGKRSSAGAEIFVEVLPSAESEVLKLSWTRMAEICHPLSLPSGSHRLSVL